VNFGNSNSPLSAPSYPLAAPSYNQQMQPQGYYPQQQQYQQQQPQAYYQQQQPAIPQQSYNNMVFQQQPPQQQQQQSGFGFLSSNGSTPPPPPPPQPGFINSVIAPSMLSPTAARKSIPTADSMGGKSFYHFCSSFLIVFLLCFTGSSGFSFMGSVPSGMPSSAAANNKGSNNNNNNKDSFNFVTEAMKDMKK
jgi:hypothetical protein